MSHFVAKISITPPAGLKDKAQALWEKQMGNLEEITRRLASTKEAYENSYQDLLKEMRSSTVPADAFDTYKSAITALRETKGMPEELLRKIYSEYEKWADETADPIFPPPSVKEMHIEDYIPETFANKHGLKAGFHGNKLSEDIKNKLSDVLEASMAFEAYRDALRSNRPLLSSAHQNLITAQHAQLSLQQYTKALSLVSGDENALNARIPLYDGDGEDDRTPCSKIIMDFIPMRIEEILKEKFPADPSIEPLFTAMNPDVGAFRRAVAESMGVSEEYRHF